MTVLRVLVFGNRHEFPPYVTEATTRSDVIQPTYCEWRSLTAIQTALQGGYDVVVIYDRGGKGLELARQVAQSLEELGLTHRTIILKNGWSLAEEAPYIRLGYTQFGLLTRMLGAEEPPLSYHLAGVITGLQWRAQKDSWPLDKAVTVLKPL